jgi:hypothetical protein
VYEAASAHAHPRFRDWLFTRKDLAALRALGVPVARSAQRRQGGDEPAR